MSAKQPSFVIRACVLAAACAAAGMVQAADSPWLYGIHWYGDPASNNVEIMTGGKGIWVLETVLTEDTGIWSPAAHLPKLQTAVARGHTVIVRIQPRWGLNVPGDESAVNPADRMSTFLPKVVAAAQLFADVCHIWQIGNEPNLGLEYDIGLLTPQMYVQKYIPIRDAIKSVASSLGPQIVLVAPTAPVDPGWLGGLCDQLNLQGAGVDAFGLHGYRSNIMTDFDVQLDLIDSKGFSNKPIYVTEWGAPVDPIGPSVEAGVAQYLHQTFQAIANYNATPGNHDIVCACWFVYRYDTFWNSWSIEWLRGVHSPGINNDLYDAFQYACTLNLPAGSGSSGGSGIVINRSPSSLNSNIIQGTNAPNQTFTVSNSGVGTLSYSITDNVSWLSVNPSFGTSTGEADTITVSYTTSGLPIGTHNATITISDPSADNNPQLISVTMTVQSSQTPPTVNNPDFQANGGGWAGAAIGWTAFGGNKWEGVFDGARSWVQGVSEFPANGVCGVYQVISGVVQGTQYQVSVYGMSQLSSSLDCAIGVDPGGGTNPNNATFGTPSTAGAWTQVTHSFTGTGSNATLFLRGRNITGGFVSGKWCLFDGVAIQITGQAGPPTITRSPATLTPSCTQGTNAANQTFTVHNTGGGTLNYAITDNVSWLSVNPASGNSTGEVDTITVSYTTSGLTQGTHNATITISDANATNNPQTLAVTLTVNPPAAQPTITRSLATLSPSVVQGGNASNQTFTVQNTGSGTLNYSITDNVSWLSVNPASGNSTGEVDAITVSYTTSGLAVGTHNATITISDPNATNNPQTIAVTLTVTKKTVAEDFNSVPSWNSEYNATWGGAASWSSTSGGQAGNHLQATRSNNGSSSKVKVLDISPNTNYTISIYMKGASASSTYWVECAYKLGSNSAQNFDGSAGTWTMIKKFENVSGSNGNGNVWTQYTKTFNSGSNTQISVGFKTGLAGSTAPVARWDTLRVQ
jgi:hypothetical protein